MRIVAIIIMFSIYTGCVDKKPKITLDKSFCLNNDYEAIKLAEKEWITAFGKSIYKTTPFIAELKNDSIWIVYGTLPKNYVGGTPYAEINAKNCEVLIITHGK